MIKLLVLLSLSLTQVQRSRIVGPVDENGYLLINCTNCGEVSGPVNQGNANDGGVNWGVYVGNWPSTQTVAGTVTVKQGVSLDGGYSWPVEVKNFPGTQPVSGTFWQATQPVSIASMPSTPVTGTFWQGTQPVSGPLTDTQLRASAVPVSGTFWPATQPVSGTLTCNAGSGTMAVSGPLTDTQLRATAVPVSGTFWQATQPVSGSVSVSNFPATQPVSGTLTCNAGSGTLAVSGPLTDTQLRASAVSTQGTETANVASPVPSRADYMGVRENLNLVGLVQCDKTAQISVASAANTTIVSSLPTQVIFVCTTVIEIQGVATTAGTGRIIYGTGTNCGTGTVNVTPDFVGSTTAGQPWGIMMGANIGYSYKTAANNSLCYTSTTTTPQKVFITYAQFTPP